MSDSLDTRINMNHTQSKLIKVVEKFDASISYRLSCPISLNTDKLDRFISSNGANTIAGDDGGIIFEISIIDDLNHDYIHGLIIGYLNALIDQK